MNRDSFPTLTEGDTGWPTMTVAWDYAVPSNDVAVEVSPLLEDGRVPVVSISSKTVRPHVYWNGNRIA